VLFGIILKKNLTINCAKITIFAHQKNNKNIMYLPQENIDSCADGGCGVVITLTPEELQNLNKKEENEEYSSSYRERNFDAYED
jgi:hypothetical protein